MIDRFSAPGRTTSGSTTFERIGQNSGLFPHLVPDSSGQEGFSISHIAPNDLTIVEQFGQAVCIERIVPGCTRPFLRFQRTQLIRRIYEIIRTRFQPLIKFVCLCSFVKAAPNSKPFDPHAVTAEGVTVQSWLALQRVLPSDGCPVTFIQ